MEIHDSKKAVRQALLGEHCEASIVRRALWGEHREISCTFHDCNPENYKLKRYLHPSCKLETSTCYLFFMSSECHMYVQFLGSKIMRIKQLQMCGQNGMHRHWAAMKNIYQARMLYLKSPGSSFIKYLNVRHYYILWSTVCLIEFKSCKNLLFENQERLDFLSKLIKINFII